MENIQISYNHAIGTMRPMHAVNNGPIAARADQTRGNFPAYRDAGIPFARTHDASFCAAYGGEHTVDISAIFPDFSRDANDSTAYDFIVTDHYLRSIRDAGTQVFYRLGSKIEHGVKKYGTLPPADFFKWAQICEHIIRHYNEGWADGFCWNIVYWEIWNEPDLDSDDSANKRTWGGTEAQFHELYKITAIHLKKSFPLLKIGGPALAGNLDWAERFITDMAAQSPRVPLDFFSWHIYTTEPAKLVKRGETVRKLLDQSGYTATESICNEWNWVEGWSDLFVHSIQKIIGLKGAAFTAACMCAGQNSGLDMLMYYDARPSVFNGLFDYYTLAPLKGYYPFLMFQQLYQLGTQTACTSSDPELYVVSAADKSGTGAALIVYYTNRPDAAPKTLHITGADGQRVYLLDDSHNMECVGELPDALEIAPNTVVLLR